MSVARQLRELLGGSEPVIAPGAYDAITARAVEAAGFPAVYMTGAGTSAALGYPDYGLVGLSEMAENVARVTQAVGIPVIADADTGYGNELNVTRTVQEYAARGAAALHIEDQVFPKRCGHLEDKQVVPAEDFLRKIRAAVDASGGDGPMVIARTDARAVHGIEEAVERANRALDVGADMAFVEAPQSIEEVFAIPREVRGPCLLNLVRGGKTPPVSLAQASEAGYRLVILPGVLLAAVVAGCEAALSELRRTGEPPLTAGDLTLVDMFRRFGSERWDEVRRRYVEVPAST
jgi:2-methylisocitrate lyase-like PEP mutase family enzyme